MMQKRPKSLPHRKFKRFSFLFVFQIISDFKANFVFHIRNTNTPALSAHAVNCASHIKRVFTSSPFNYSIIYRKAPLFKGKHVFAYRRSAQVTEVGYLKFIPKFKFKTYHFLLEWQLKGKIQNRPAQTAKKGGGGGELANL